MYVVLIALLYVLMMMVVTSDSIFKGAIVLLFGGALIALVLYLLDTPRRVRSRRLLDALEAESSRVVQRADQTDEANTRANQ